METLIKGGTLVSDGRTARADILISGDRIGLIAPDLTATGADVIDATGCIVMPGVIDEHVHFREPGLTDKADIGSESRAAAYGGVTTYFDMPNCLPQTTTLEALDDKLERAAQTSHVNYAFFFGATGDNVELFDSLTANVQSSNFNFQISNFNFPVPGIKLFMGASTGNMLVDGRQALDGIFAACARLGLPLMTHCEDTQLINGNMRAAKEAHGDDPDISLHPLIRSRQACLQSSRLAAELARQHATRLHIAHLSTAEELALLDPAHGITGEACLAHLLFDESDYKRRGARIKCNPAVKSATDRDALRRAVADGRITTVATDHAPHLLSQKQGGAARAASGMPMVQFSLVSMLGLVDEGVLTLERLVEVMCHAPARLFGIEERGFLRPGCKADIAIVRRGEPWTLREADIQSKCGWSPLTGDTFAWRVEHTFCNGHHIYNRGSFDASVHGEPVTFRR